MEWCSAPCVRRGDPYVVGNFFPNVITPNGDEANDFLKVTVRNAVKCSLVVVDRFGVNVCDKEWIIPNGAYNFDMVWNGRTTMHLFGIPIETFVAEGEYFYRVYLWSCEDYASGSGYTYRSNVMNLTVLDADGPAYNPPDDPLNPSEYDITLCGNMKRCEYELRFNGISMNDLFGNTFTFQAANKITLDNVTMSSSTVAAFYAGEIDLKPNVIIEEGAFVDKIISPCDPVSERLGFNVGEAVHYEADTVIRVPIDESESKKHSTLSLYPNPYSREVTFGFVMPESGRVTVKVSDMMGRLVAVPWENKEIGAGVSSWVWDGSGLSDGVYVVSVSAGPTTQTLKLIKAGK